jgi:hypothetical protein
MTSHEPLSEEELERLGRHARRTWGFFVAFWMIAIPAVLAIEFLGLSESMVRSLIGTLGGAVIVGVFLQFSEKCPRCNANLGWQARLGVPDQCQRCGVPLKSR